MYFLKENQNSLFLTEPQEIKMERERIDNVWLIGEFLHWQHNRNKGLLNLIKLEILWMTSLLKLLGKKWLKNKLVLEV